MKAGRWITMRIRKANPEIKSIQLAKFFNSPKEDFAKRITPKITRSAGGNAPPTPNIKINPAITSIPPSSLINIIFKLIPLF